MTKNFLSNKSLTAISPITSSATNQSSSILTNQGSAFRTIQTSRIWSLCVHEDWPIRYKGWEVLSLYKSAPFWLRERTFTFHLRLKDCISPAGAETPYISSPWTREESRCTRARQSGIGWNGAEQRCLAREGPCLRATSSQGYPSPMLSCNWAVTLLSYAYICAVSQLSCLHWVKFHSSLNPKLGISVGAELAPRTIGWQYLHLLLVGYLTSQNLSLGLVRTSKMFRNMLNIFIQYLASEVT